MIVPTASAFADFVAWSSTTRVPSRFTKWRRPGIGVAVHDVVAAPGRRPPGLEVGRVDLELREPDLPFDQEVPAGDEHDLPGREAREEVNGQASDLALRSEELDLLARDHGRREPGLDGLDLDLRKGRGVDPDRPAVERPRFVQGVEAHGVGVAPVHLLHSFEPVAVVLAEPEVEGQRQHLLGLKHGEGGPLGPPPRAVQQEHRLFPLAALSVLEEAVLGDHVEAGIGGGGPEVHLHASLGQVALDLRVLSGLRLLVTEDDLGHRWQHRLRSPPSD